MKEILCIKIRDKTYRLTRKSLTFLLNIIDNYSFDDKKYYLQISTREPWFIPKRDTISNGNVILWGWMFFYIGCDTKMLGGRL